MPVATVLIASSPEDTVNRIARPKRVVIKQVESPKRQFSFPIGPLNVQYEGIGIEYINIERPGDVSLLESETQKPRTLTFDAIIADVKTRGLTSVETQLTTLSNMAREDVDLTFTYGVRSLDYRVRITNFSITSVYRDVDGNITQAAVNIQLTERPRRNIDPITLNAIRYEPAKSPAKSKKPGKSSGANKTTSGGTNNSGKIGPVDPTPPRTAPVVVKGRPS